MESTQVKTKKFIVNVHGVADQEKIKAHCLNYLKKANIKEVKK